MKKKDLSQNLIKRDVRIIGGVAKIVEIENGKIIKVIRDYKRHNNYQNDTFIDIANRFYNNIKEFISIHGDEYYNYNYNIFEEFDKDYPKNMHMHSHERWELFENYKHDKLKKLPSKKLRKIICDYIIERFHLVCETYNIKIPYFKNERNDMDLWFKKNCNYLFDFGIISKHVNGIDYLCEYGFDPLVISFMSKDEKVSEFFKLFVIPNSTHKECGTKHLTVELEYQSGNFNYHGHSIEHTDMVICFENNKRLDLPTLELCKWSEKPIKREIDQDIEDLDHHLASEWNSLSKRVEYVQKIEKEKLIGRIYDLLKYIENHRSRDNEEQEIKNFLISDHRLRMILDALSIINIIKKEHINDIINNGIISTEFFIDKDILSTLINENKVIYS